MVEFERKIYVAKFLPFKCMIKAGLWLQSKFNFAAQFCYTIPKIGKFEFTTEKVLLT